MKKNIVKLLAITLATTSLVSLASCKAEKVSNDDNMLEVYAWDAGYGVGFVEPMLKEFGEQSWVKEKYPNFRYHISSNDTQSYSKTRIEMGSANTIDLFFGSSVETLIGSDFLVDLTEPVYNQKVPGEEVLYKDKVRSDILEKIGWKVNKKDKTEAPKYYTVPWCMGSGIVAYNETLFDELGLEVPLTTDQMFTLMQEVKDMEGKNSAYPYTYSLISSKVSYSHYMFDIWWAQYEGVDGIEDFYNAIDYDGIRNSPEVIKQTGRLEMLKVMEKLYKESSGYYDRSSSNYEFVAGQTRLLAGQGLIMFNGDWFSCEMAQLANEYRDRGIAYDIRTMRTPVISALVNKTPSIKAVATAQGKTNDEVLAEVIKEVDAGKTESEIEGITQKDFNTVMAARGVITSLAASHSIVVPSYATAKNLAVDFVRFVATNKANEIYAKETFGGRMAFNWNLQSDAPELYDELAKNHLFKVQADIWEYYNEVQTSVIPDPANFDFAYYGGFGAKVGMDSYEETFKSKPNATAEDLLNGMYNYWTANDNARWNLALQQAGMA